MKTIKKDELFESLGDFLKGKGVELKEGVYSLRIRQACNLLGDAINATQKTAKRAKDEVDRKLDQLRRSIHETTAPKRAASARTAKKGAAGSRGKQGKRTARKPVSKSRKPSRRK